MKTVLLCVCLLIAALAQAETVTNVGLGTSPNAGNGDAARVAFDRLNRNDNLLQSQATANAAAIAAQAASLASSAQTTINRRLVIVGSSTPAGTGASTYAASWAGLLSTNLAAKGWTVNNQAVAGYWVTNCMQGFFTNVSAQKPSVVLIGIGVNELVDSPARYPTVVSNVLVLVQMCRQIGATPVLIKLWPSQTTSAGFAGAKYAFNALIETWGIPIIDHMSPCDDGTRNATPFASVVSDGLHMNSAGHAQLYNAIPLTLFDHLTRWGDERIRPSAGGIHFNEIVTNGVEAVSFTPSDPMRSFTVTFWCRKTAGPYDQGVFTVVGMGQGSARVRARSNSTWDIDILNDAVAANIPPENLKWIHLAWTYNDLTTSNCFYANGTLAGIAYGTLTNTPRFIIGGRSAADNFASASNVEFRDMAIYRVPLGAKAIEDIYYGTYPRASLENFTPFTETTNIFAGMTLANLAPIDGGFVVNDNTRIVPIGTVTTPSEFDAATRLGALTTNVVFLAPGSITNQLQFSAGRLTNVITVP
jgi:lysophospholipase L1-like esterase